MPREASIRRWTHSFLKHDKLTFSNGADPHCQHATCEIVEMFSGSYCCYYCYYYYYYYYYYLSNSFIFFVLLSTCMCLCRKFKSRKRRKQWTDPSQRLVTILRAWRASDGFPRPVPVACFPAPFTCVWFLALSGRLALACFPALSSCHMFPALKKRKNFHPRVLQFTSFQELNVSFFSLFTYFPLHATCLFLRAHHSWFSTLCCTLKF